MYFKNILTFFHHFSYFNAGKIFKNVLRHCIFSCIVKQDSDVVCKSTELELVIFYVWFSHKKYIDNGLIRADGKEKNVYIAKSEIHF